MKPTKTKLIISFILFVITFLIIKPYKAYSIDSQGDTIYFITSLLGTTSVYISLLISLVLAYLLSCVFSYFFISLTSNKKLSRFKLVSLGFLFLVVLLLLISVICYHRPDGIIHCGSPCDDNSWASPITSIFETPTTFCAAVCVEKKVINPMSPFFLVLTSIISTIYLLYLGYNLIKMIKN